MFKKTVWMIINKDFSRRVKRWYEDNLSSAFLSEDLVMLESTFCDFSMLIADSCTYIIASKDIPTI
ncbi:hypothetical protein BBI08_03945 [Planococcus halocryophilus]|uniref:Uncharacterized protein n=1 Tax=Planococcus halocryophilus TaxID=1215089 RepID=A0A1C7DNK1_9BACL|nr:hypothetical protein BBI08_03945 [Planococcus halocryophilus]